MTFDGSRPITDNCSARERKADTRLSESRGDRDAAVCRLIRSIETRGRYRVFFCRHVRSFAVMSCLAVWPVAALFGLGFGLAPRRNGILVNPPLSLSHAVVALARCISQRKCQAARAFLLPDPPPRMKRRADWRRLLFRPQLWEKQARRSPLEPF